jgi:hypothetical protein
MADIDKSVVTSDSQVLANAALLDLPVFSAEDAALRDKALAELSEHERLALRHRERWLHRRRATDQLSVR